MTKNRTLIHFFKVIFIISILLFFCFPQTEKAGIKATEYLKENINIKKGTLIILPRANIFACEENVRCFPPEINLNRVYPGNPQGNSIEKLASGIFNLMKRYDIGLLVDLHESVEFYKKNPKNYGQTVVIDSDDDIVISIRF